LFGASILLLQFSLICKRYEEQTFQPEVHRLIRGDSAVGGLTVEFDRSSWFDISCIKFFWPVLPFVEITLI